MLRTGVLMVLLFAGWTALVQTVDVQRVGQAGTEVGFATLNSWFHQMTGVHMALYTITDWLALVPIVVCLGFAAMGLAQMVERRSLLKVDADIILLGVYYLMVMLTYLLFERIPINYRPILMEGRLETSYPSSTTLLVLSVMPTLVFQAHRRMRNAKGVRAIAVLTAVFSLFMVIGRLVSGVHWVTDIIGSVLLSGGLFCMYCVVVI